MPLINPSHDSLPYIDRPPTPTSTARAHTLIRSSLPPDTSLPHPLLPRSPLDTIPHSPLIQLELARLATTPSPPPLSAIDLSRYESTTSPVLLPETDLESAKESLRAAYVNKEYLRMRVQSLELLEKWGRNKWLVGNWEVEGELGALEKELVGVRVEVEGVNRERKGYQEGGRGRMEGLEGEWREGIRGVLEVGVETGRVEGDVREVLRRGGR